MFIQTEETPNPATMKFLPGRIVMQEGTLEVKDAKSAENSPLAEALFKVEGVKGVFLAQDFITITKSEDKTWPVLKPTLLTAIMDHMVSGRPTILSSENSKSDTTTAAPSSEESDVVKQIRELLDIKIRPAVAQDGGDITFHSFEDGIVYLVMKGSCAGCPSSTATLRSGVENMLKHYIPEVNEVRQLR